jgi:hypothetical protein
LTDSSCIADIWRLTALQINPFRACLVVELFLHHCSPLYVSSFCHYTAISAQV